MLKHFSKKTVILTLLAVVTFCINQFPLLIEKYYSQGLYVYLSLFLRFLLGWIPFSVGDIAYATAIIWVIKKIVDFISKWRRGQLYNAKHYLSKVYRIILFTYIIFNWLWGFNYSRLGSVYQMNLNFKHYTTNELSRLTDTLLCKIRTIVNDSSIEKVSNDPYLLASESQEAYKTASDKFAFLNYNKVSVKPQILYKYGTYIGFLGYLNPFTLEAQLNTEIPKVLLPYVTCHEIAHQLGYASESEANFVGYIACRESKSAAFKYSVYLDLFSYAVRNLYQRDSILAINKLKLLPEKAKIDRKKIKFFFNKYQNPFTPLLDWVYDKYLKANHQPKGRESYDEVVGWLIAYANRYGWENI